MNPPTPLQNVVWDLDHLVAGPTGVDQALGEADRLAAAFAHPLSLRRVFGASFSGDKEDTQNPRDVAEQRLPPVLGARRRV
jgi:hypothetical protein